MGRHRSRLEEQRWKRKETETCERREERNTKIIGRKDETNMAEDRGKYQSTHSNGEGWGGLCTRTHITQTEQRRTSGVGQEGVGGRENVSGWWRQ